MTPAFVPSIGSFAVLKIDAVASVAYLDDLEATAAAARLVNRDYVVYALRPGGLPNAHAEFREARPAFIMQGIPQDIPERFIEAGMSMPIAPQTFSVDEHPSHREPLVTTPNPFPWPNCFMTIFTHTEVRCRNVPREESVVCELGQDERTRYRHFAGEDDDRQGALKDEQEATNSDASSLQDSSEDEMSVGVGEDGAEETLDEPEADVEPLNEDETAAFFRELLSAEVPEDLITVTFSYDLHRVKKLNNPQQYFDEVDSIAEIIKASQARKDATKISVAQRNADRYDDKTAELLQNHQASQDSDAPSMTCETKPSFPEQPHISVGHRMSQVLVRGARLAKTLIRRILCMSSSHNP
ncbi:hypothetical protein MIND_01358700 [Mycena indigotica]|uniref:Uncharacterized protein n=1 Tax=Mycena indigotica TaxID=2126181 RepID=A0A8H6RZK2_9AGAR|nr:uncharacterized protein MIND_01358700 [Mycena indigotica]KAF7289843.1 hypothetical protein MIND_01358700 [Mycena indigotica]